MAEKLYMIALSPTMTEGTLARWKVSEGQAFKAGSVLCEVETDKASMDYEAPKDGVLLKVLLAEGGRAAVGDVIGIIGKAGESPDALLAQLSPGAGGAGSKAGGTEAAAAAPTVAASAASASPVPGTAGPGLSRPVEPPVAAHAGPAPSSPLARVLAAELGVDIRTLRGTGPGGRVVKRDVEAAAAGGSGGPAPGRAGPVPAGARPGSGPSSSAVPRGPTGEQTVRMEPVAGKRAVIARRLSESFFSAPHYYLKRTVDAGRLLALREALADPEGRKPSINALLAKLAAAALAGHPAVNAGWKDEGAGKASVEYRSRVDIGLAVALPDGLITPVVRDCGSKGISRIDAEMSDLVAKAKGSGLSPEEYTGATFTITNLGGFGVEEFTAIINPPGSAILAVGAALDEPVALPDGTVAVRKRMRLTLGCDHRVIDGAVGAAFLRDLAGMIEEPGRALA
ncbi:MAG TPA: dihydrolipoamide acetyltransferase family protein [Spirochaetia bacterium]|nr:dihydrolipoamide acetyltransferase family protein [Spirochaetales bacterium]HRY79961.1 dihydrolipoamide acetyltransferase family protein [Spirochaetia bacterium]